VVWQQKKPKHPTAQTQKRWKSISQSKKCSAPIVLGIYDNQNFYQLFKLRQL